MGSSIFVVACNAQLWPVGSAVVAPRLISCPVARGILPGQGSILCLLREQPILIHCTTREVPVVSDFIMVQSCSILSCFSDDINDSCWVLFFLTFSLCIMIPPSSPSYLFIWPCGMAYEILVPWLGIEPGPSAVDAWSPNHWTARGVPLSIFNFVRGFIWCLVTSGSQFIFGSRHPKLWKRCTCECMSRVLTIDFTVGWAVWTICIGGSPRSVFFSLFSCLSLSIYIWMHVCVLSRFTPVQLLVTPWTVAH